MSSCIDMSTAGRIFQSPRDPCVIYINIGFNPKGAQIYPQFEPALGMSEWQYNTLVANLREQFDDSGMDPCLCYMAVACCTIGMPLPAIYM